MTKKILFLQSSAPYQNSKAQANLNLLMIAASFEISVSLVFTGDGVFQLLKRQESEVFDRKNIAKQVLGLELFAVDNIYVTENSLSPRNLTIDDFIIKPELIKSTHLQQLMREHDFIIRL